jgi:hypothetical protein
MYSMQFDSCILVCFVLISTCCIVNYPFVFYSLVYPFGVMSHYCLFFALFTLL